MSKQEKLIDDIGSLKFEIELLNTKLKAKEEKLKILLSNSKAEDNNLMYGKKYKCKLVKRVTVKYDVDKLKRKMNKNIFKDFVKEKTTTIVDVKGFIKILENNGIEFKDIKDTLHTEIKLDTSTIDKYYNQGIFDLKDIKGCYTTSVSEYFSITSLDKE